MKKSEITLYGIYTNGKGRVRQVVDEGPEYTLYSGQKETDNVQYEIIKDGSKRNRTFGNRENMTRASFASWAKERVDTYDKRS